MKKILILILILSCSLGYGQLVTGTYKVGQLQIDSPTRTTDTLTQIVVRDSVTRVTKIMSRNDFLKGIVASTYTKLVYVNTTTPNTATVFSEETPPTVDDPALDGDTANLYIGTDGSKWTYNGSTYVTEVVPSSSNFKIIPNIDAGNNKTSAIYREGSISSYGYLSSRLGNFITRNGSNTPQLGAFVALLNYDTPNGNVFQLNSSNGLDLWNYSSSSWTKRFTFSGTGDFTASSFNGYTPENVSNKSDSYTASSTTTYPNNKALVDGLATKQDELILTTTGSSGPSTLIGSTLNIPQYLASSGTVTDISVVTANGISGSVANSTTTPELTLSMQDATASQSGKLTNTDWNTFNEKQAAIGYTPENTSNKQNSLDVDGSGDKFPTVDAVNGEFDNIKSQINPNTYVVYDAGYSQVVQDITINTGWQWKINNIDKTNASPIVINIPLAASGYQRIDLIVLNTSNIAVRVAGTATTGMPVSPAVPLNTIQILFITTDSTVSTPVIPKPRYPVSQFLRNGETNYSPSEDIVYDANALKVDKNTVITGATNTKITYDSKGLITSGTSLSAGDIPNISESQVTNLTTDLAGKQPTLSGTGFVKSTSGTISYDTNTYVTIQGVVEIGTSFTLDNTYNGKVVILIASCTVTIPNGLVAGFECSFVTLAGVTQTVSLGGLVVLFNNVRTTMTEKLSFTLKNRTATNNYITVGNL